MRGPIKSKIKRRVIYIDLRNKSEENLHKLQRSGRVRKERRRRAEEASHIPLRKENILTKKEAKFKETHFDERALSHKTSSDSADDCLIRGLMALVLEDFQRVLTINIHRKRVMSDDISEKRKLLYSVVRKFILFRLITDSCVGTPSTQ